MSLNQPTPSAITFCRALWTALQLTPVLADPLWEALAADVPDFRSAMAQEEKNLRSQFAQFGSVIGDHYHLKNAVESALASGRTDLRDQLFRRIPEAVQWMDVGPAFAIRLLAQHGKGKLSLPPHVSAFLVASVLYVKALEQAADMPFPEKVDAVVGKAIADLPNSVLLDALIKQCEKRYSLPAVRYVLQAKALEEEFPETARALSQKDLLPAFNELVSANPAVKQKVDHDATTLTERKKSLKKQEDDGLELPLTGAVRQWMDASAFVATRIRSKAVNLADPALVAAVFKLEAVKVWVEACASEGGLQSPSIPAPEAAAPLPYVPALAQTLGLGPSSPPVQVAPPVNAAQETAYRALMSAVDTASASQLVVLLAEMAVASGDPSTLAGPAWEQALSRARTLGFGLSHVAQVITQCEKRLYQRRTPFGVWANVLAPVMKEKPTQADLVATLESTTSLTALGAVLSLCPMRDVPAPLRYKTTLRILEAWGDEDQKRYGSNVIPGLWEDFRCSLPAALRDCPEKVRVFAELVSQRKPRALAILRQDVNAGDQMAWALALDAVLPVHRRRGSAEVGLGEGLRKAWGADPDPKIALRFVVPELVRGQDLSAALRALKALSLSLRYTEDDKTSSPVYRQKVLDVFSESDRIRLLGATAIVAQAEALLAREALGKEGWKWPAGLTQNIFHDLMASLKETPAPASLKTNRLVQRALKVSEESELTWAGWLAVAAPWFDPKAPPPAIVWQEGATQKKRESSEGPAGESAVPVSLDAEAMRSALASLQRKLPTQAPFPSPPGLARMLVDSAVRTPDRLLFSQGGLIDDDAGEGRAGPGFEKPYRRHERFCHEGPPVRMAKLMGIDTGKVLALSLSASVVRGELFQPAPPQPTAAPSPGPA